MSTSEIVSLLAGVVGTLVTVWAALAGRQLLRPRLAVGLGPLERVYESPRWRKSRAGTIAVGLAAPDVQYLVFPLVLRLHNRSALPISEVDLVIEFPAGALVEKAGTVGPLDGTAGIITGRWPEGRTIARFQGLAQCRIPIGLIRPGETAVGGELLQLRAGLLATVTGADGAETLRRRYSSLGQLRSAVEVRISIWSATAKPISLVVTVAWLAAASQEELLSCLQQMVELSALERPIDPGIYILSPLRGRSFSRAIRRTEIVDLAIIEAKNVADLANAVSFDAIINSEQGAVRLRVPPWGLWGDSFDLTAKYGARLLGRRATRRPPAGP